MQFFYSNFFLMLNNFFQYFSLLINQAYIVHSLNLIMFDNKFIIF